MFTEQDYIKIIDLLKTRFTFIDYGQKNKGPSIIVRYDIDHSPQRALALARIENLKGVKATYHVMLCSKYYNVFEIEIIEILKKIISYGHKIGLHFDMDSLGGSYKVESNVIIDRIKFELKILEKLLNIKTTSLSFHNYTKHKNYILNNKYISGKINASSNFINSKYFYISDSNGIWKNRTLEEVAKDESIKNIHV